MQRGIFNFGILMFTYAHVTEMQREKEKSKNFMACWLHKKGIIKHLKGLKRITTHSNEPIIISWIYISSSWILLLLLSMMWIQHVWFNSYKVQLFWKRKKKPINTILENISVHNNNRVINLLSNIRNKFSIIKCYLWILKLKYWYIYVVKSK